MRITVVADAVVDAPRHPADAETPCPPLLCLPLLISFPPLCAHGASLPTQSTPTMDANQPVSPRSFYGLRLFSASSADSHIIPFSSDASASSASASSSSTSSTSSVFPSLYKGKGWKSNDKGDAGESISLLNGRPNPNGDLLRSELDKSKGIFCGCAPRTRLILAIAGVFFLGFTVIMVIVGFKVLAPNFVKGRIAATSLSFSQLIIHAPPSSSVAAGAVAGAGGVFDIEVAAILSGLSPVGGTLNSFQATLSYKGSPVGTFTMPSLPAAANKANALSFRATVTSQEPAFTAFSTDVLLLPTVDVTLSGVVSVTTVVAGSAITVPGVDFSKVVSLVGCNGLKGGVVTSFSLVNSNATQAIADISVAISNPSVVGLLPLGDVGADVKYGSVVVGKVVSRGAQLLPFPAITTLNFSGVLVNNDTPTLNALISAYLSGDTSFLTATPRRCQGAEVCPNPIPLFYPLLDSGVVVLAATLPPSPTPLITGVDVGGMFLQPQGSRTVGISINSTVRVSPLLGFNSPFLLTGIGLNCTLGGDTGPNAFETLGLLNVPLYRVSPPIPALPLPGGGGLGVSVSLPAVLDITQSDAEFTKFVAYFINAERVRIALQAGVSGQAVLSPSLAVVDISCVLGNLTVSVPLNVTSTLLGIQGFPGVKVEEFKVLDSDKAPPGTVGISITVVLFNPSIATFPLGVNATLGVNYQGFPLGQAVIFNTTLAPGNNTILATGYLQPPPASLPAASAVFSAYLGGVPSSLNVTGMGVVLGPNLPTPSWLQQAVQSLTLTASIPGLAPSVARSLISNTTLVGLNLDLYDVTKGEFYPTPIASGKVCALLSLPFSLPVATLASVNVSVAFSTAGGPTLATLTNSFQRAVWAPCTTVADCTPLLAACNAPVRGEVGEGWWGELGWEGSSSSGSSSSSSSSSSSGSKISSGGRVGAPSVDPTQLLPAGVLGLELSPKAVVLLDTVGFSGLVGSILRESSIPITLVGSASPTIVGLPFGSVALSGIPLDTSVIVTGLANLTNPPAAVSSGQITDTLDNGLKAVVQLNITNPSILSGVFGPVTFGLGYYGEDGEGGSASDWDNPGGLPAVMIYVDNLALGPGEQFFSIPAVFTIPPPTASFALAKVQQLLGRFLSQISTNTTLLGLDFPGVVSSGSPILQPAFGSLRAGCVFPGIPEPLLFNATLIPDLGSLFNPPLKANASLNLNNVLNVSLTIAQANLTLYLCDNESVTPQGVVCVGQQYSDPLGFFYKGDLLKDYGGVVSPKLSNVNSPYYPVAFLANSDDVAKVLADAATDKDVLTKANGTVVVSLQGKSGKKCVVQLALEQKGVPVCLFDAIGCDVRRVPQQ